MLLKTLFRTIKQTLGRYLAIFAIIALGVGFFVGLRVTEKSMLRTADGYLKELSFNDFRLVSTLLFTEEDVAAFQKLPNVKAAEGAFQTDIISCTKNSGEEVYHVHSLQTEMNGVDLVSGRMPKDRTECLLDAKFSDETYLNTKISLSESNPEETKTLFTEQEFTVVGLVNASSYINFERGQTSLLSGTVEGFVYVHPEAFSVSFFSEIGLTMDSDAEIYSEAYDTALENLREPVERLLSERAERRYQDICEETREKMAAGGAPEDMIDATLSGIEKANVFALDRSTNIGYASLKNDTAIVSGVAKVFPLFFFLVAALVCITTMTRMVSEQRVENGIRKALGYKNGQIASLYLLYSGSASVVGCVAGFLLGSKFMPMALWKVYQIMYSMKRPVAFLLDGRLFFVCSSLYLLCSLSATWLVCSRDLSSRTAELMRPKTPVAGKRVLLERLPFLWKRLRFLHKVSIRNIFRNKKRMLMMILGIGGCTALLLTGFGIRDSIKPIVDYQYSEINLYDAQLQVLSSLDRNDFHEITDEILFIHTGKITVKTEEQSDTVQLVAAQEDTLSYVDFHKGETKLSWPKTGEALINYRLARENSIKIGDELILVDANYQSLKVTVSGIFDNFISDYVYVDEETFLAQWGKSPEQNSAYLNFKKGADPHEEGAKLLSVPGVVSATLSEDMKIRVGEMLKSLDYIILIVLVCAGALAFIVLYNLTNISIIERTREIATLKVLGFFQKEQNSYVFRENLLLTLISSLCGIPMGILLLQYVMAQIKISSMYFGCRLSWSSYLYAVLLTFFFTLFVDLFLTGKTKRINMAEAMKAVE